MSYETYSLFDALEADQTNQRVASRRALALAQTRVANKMGKFFRGAQTEEEFLERLGLLQDDFDYIVKSASEEVGYDRPDYIKQTLVDHYASLTKEANPFDPNAVAQQQPAQGAPAIAPMEDPTAAPSGEPLAFNPAAQATPNVPPPNIPQIPGTDPNQLAQQMTHPQQQPVMASWKVVAEDGHWIDKAIKHPGALHKELGVPEGQKIPEDKLEEAEHSDNPEEKKRAEFAEELKGFHHHDSAVTELDPFINANTIQAMASWLGQPNSDAVNPHMVLAEVNHTFPGGVRGFLEQNGLMQERTSSWTVVADGNTDLGGPEPKIDKAHQTDSNPKKDVLGDEDKGTWPTKRKDVTEPIIRENREVGGHPHHELEEIGEKNTEHVDLPAAKGNDAGFADGGVTKQDGPGTWHGNDGQVDPVTHETIK